MQGDNLCTKLLFPYLHMKILKLWEIKHFFLKIKWVLNTMVKIFNYINQTIYENVFKCEKASMYFKDIGWGMEFSSFLPKWDINLIS